jgi:streptogramin lyase
VNNYRRILGLKNSKWDTLANVNSGSNDNGNLGDFLRMYYKAFDVNPLGNIFIGSYGTGVLTLIDSNKVGIYSKAINYNPLAPNKDPNLCIDPTIADGYTVSPSILYLPEAKVNIIGWMGSVPKTHNYGLGIVDSTGKITCFNNVGTTNVPTGIGLANQEGTEFLIPQSGGIDRYRFNSQNTAPFNLLKTYSIENIGEARSFTLDSYNRIWVQGVNALGLICTNGSDEGLCKYVTNTDSILNVSAAIGLPSGQINDIATDANGNIWVATETKGVMKIDPRHGLSAGNRITYYKEEDGLASNLVRDLAIDSKNGMVWFAHENSISALSITARVVIDSTVRGEGFQLYPNPFKKSEHSKIRMDGLLPDAEIVVYTRSFQEVIRFRKSQIVGGYLEWDGRARNGAELAPGMYYIAVKNDKKIQRAKLVILD